MKLQTVLNIKARATLTMQFKSIFKYCAVEVLLGLFLNRVVFAKMEIMVDESLQNCTKPGTGGALDFSEFELIAESDTVLYMNGSVKFLKTAALPFKNYVYAEKFERGQWTLQAFERKYPDFCNVKNDPKEVAYSYFRVCPKCPFEAGESII